MQPRKTGDIAESPLASEPADLSGVDSPSDIAAELISDAIDASPLLRTMARNDKLAFRMLAVRVLAGPVGQALAQNADQSFSPVQLLDLVAGDGNRTLALRAICYKILLGHEGRTYEEIGREFGVTRACVQEIFTNIQARHGGIRNRRDKKPEAREACRQRRLGKRKARNAWSALTLWRHPILVLPS